MIKSWLELWKRIFDYKGITGAKKYWQSICMNMIVMFILVIPYGFSLRLLPENADVTIYALAFVFVLNIPVYALYVRRVRAIGWKAATALLVTLALPVFSGVIVGFFPSSPKDATPRKNPFALSGYLLTIGTGLFIYSSFLSFLLYHTPDALLPITAAGIAINTLAIILGFFKTIKQ